MTIVQSLSIVPTPFGLHNVTAAQAQKRCVQDTVSTSITSNMSPEMPGNCSCAYSQPYPQVLYGQQEYYPGGVSFTFNPMPVASNFNENLLPSNYNNYMKPQPISPINKLNEQPFMMQQQMPLNQLQKGGLEMMSLQENMCHNPYKLKFHNNGQTSTTDLLGGTSQVPPSQGMPDFHNLLAIITDLRKEIEGIGLDRAQLNTPPERLYSEVYKNKMLVLTKTSDLQDGEIKQTYAGETNGAEVRQDITQISDPPSHRDTKEANSGNDANDTSTHTKKLTISDKILKKDSQKKDFKVKNSKKKKSQKKAKKKKRVTYKEKSESSCSSETDSNSDTTSE